MTERAVIEALLDGDSWRWRAAMDTLPAELASRVMMTTLMNACFRQFPEGTPAADVALYVHGLRRRHLPEASLRTAPTEAAIRGVLGEPEALQGIRATDLQTAQIVVINDVAHRLQLTGLDREEFVTEILDALE